MLKCQIDRFKIVVNLLDIKLKSRCIHLKRFNYTILDTFKLKDQIEKKNKKNTPS